MKIDIFKMASKYWLIVLLLIFGLSSQGVAQDAIVKGKVVDSQKAPLMGVTIQIKGTTIGTSTNEKGEYRIKAGVGQTLIFSYIGYQTTQVNVGTQSILNVTMTEDAQAVENVVVIGYGKIQKKDLTGSIESIGGKDLVKAMTPNVTEALNGRIGGVVVSKASNRPGADMSIQIRGPKSFNTTNEPLYVIDGVPSSSGMRHINGEDIESIDILKDASSCAIYGSRGANGVIIVTTKGATKRSGFSVEYNGYVGVKTPIRIPDMLGNKGNGDEYMDFRIRQWTQKFGASSLSTDAFLTPEERRRVKYGEYYDWLREFAQDAITTNNSINVTGGSENTSYTFGASYMLDDGIAGSESFDRKTFNVGVEQRMGDKFKAGLTTYFSQNNINHGSSDALYNAYLIAPIVGRYQDNGEPTLNHRPDGRVNPFLQDKNSRHESNGWSVNSSAFLEYKPISDLSLKSMLAMQYDGAVSGNWEGTYTQYGQGVKKPNASRSEGVNSNWVWDNIITYDKKFNKNHRLHAIGLFSAQKDTHKSSGMAGEGMPYESDWHAIHTADQIVNVNSGYWESMMLSFMGRVNYTMMDRYMVTLTARYDGTSRLDPSNRWGLFPSAAVGWQMKNESFLKDVEWMDALKLRFSWGKSGNSFIAHDATWSKLDMSTYSLGGAGYKGFSLGGTLGNKNLKWEMTNEYNLGFDFGLFNNRLSGTFDIYERRTDDQISYKQVADINGYNSVIQNIGEIANRGFEFTINSVNVSKRDFTWKTNLTFSLNRNEIIDLNGSKTDDLANRRFIGKPMYVYYDVKQLGIWQLEEAKEAEKYGCAPGWPKIYDRDENGVIDQNDNMILGTQLPSWTAGMTNTFTYKNFDLSVYMYMRYGGLYNDPFTYFFTGINNQDWNKLDVPYWTPENRNNKYPGVGLESLWTQVLSQVPGTFLKIQNITFGYSLSEKALKKLRLKGLRAQVSVQNPFTFDKGYLGSDPEIIGENLTTQLSLYPMTVSLGLNLKF